MSETPTRDCSSPDRVIDLHAPFYQPVYSSPFLNFVPKAALYSTYHDLQNSDHEQYHSILQTSDTHVCLICCRPISYIALSLDPAAPRFWMVGLVLRPLGGNEKILRREMLNIIMIPNI